MKTYKLQLKLKAVLQLTTHYGWKNWIKSQCFVIHAKEIKTIYRVLGVHYVSYVKDSVDYIVLLSRRDPEFRSIIAEQSHLFKPFFSYETFQFFRREYLPNSVSVWLWSLLFFLNMLLVSMDYFICYQDLYCGLKFQVWTLIITMTTTILVPFLLYFWRLRQTTSHVLRILLKVEVVTLVFVALLVSGYIIMADSRTGHIYTQLYRAKEAILRK